MQTAIAIVMAGTFQYRSTAGRDLMTPGSLLLGNAGDCFECSHEHATGDSCLSFKYDAELFDQVAYESTRRRTDFRAPRLPPVRATSALIARASACAAMPLKAPWHELSLLLAGCVSRLSVDSSAASSGAPGAAASRVTRVVRRIEEQSDTTLTLEDLAAEACLSPYHFLRTFQAIAGVTPHQYILRTRLRKAAGRLQTTSASILDVALDSGFGDVSNFNRAFRSEFGVSPRGCRRNAMR